MATRRYAKTPAEAKNKHLILDIIYRDIGFTLKGVNSTILLGKIPMSAVRRVAKHISTKTNVIQGFEINKDTWEGLKDTGTLDRLQKILNKNGRRTARIILNNTNVMNGQVMHFEDLDFCCTWMVSRTRNADSIDDPLTMMISRLWAQKTYLKGRRAFLGTVTLRNGRGKEFSFQALNRMLKVLGWKLESIGGLVGTYDKNRAKRISKTGNIRSDGRTFHAYEHDVEISHIDEDSAKMVKLRVFTYTDDTPMLTFSLTYK